MVRLEKLFQTFAWALCCVLFSSCQIKRQKVLTLYTWADFLDPSVVESFERTHDCQLRIDTFDSNEAMYAKLKTGQREGYDLVFPSSYMAELMQEQGWLAYLDRTRLTQLSNLNQEFLRIATDSTCAYSVPYMITLTGVGYLSDRWHPLKHSWAIFGESAFKSRMTLLNDMRETIGAALLYCGHDPNSTDETHLKDAEAALLSWRKNIAKFENEQYKMGLASAEFLICHAYLGDIMQTQRDNQNVKFYLPEEGYVASCDDIVVLKTSRQSDLAHAFIEYLLTPEVAAKNAAHCQFLTPNAASVPLLDEKTAQLHRRYLAPKVLSKAHFIRDLKQKNAAYIRVWDRVKSGV